MCELTSDTFQTYKKGMSMDVSLWKLFLDTAELGSLGKVAALRGTSQPHVSRQIAELERRSGGRLFDRTGRGVVLTELGQRIAPKVRLWLAKTQELESEIQSSAGQPIGQVRLGLIPSVAHPFASELARGISQKYPLIALQLREGQGAQLDAWLYEGRIDMAVLLRAGNLSDALPLAKTETYLISARGDPLTAKKSVPFSQLKSLNLVSFCRPSAWRDQLDQIAHEQGIQLNVSLEADSLALQIALAAQGRAYALLGRYAIEQALKANHVQAAKVIEPATPRHIALATSRIGNSSLAMRTVMQEIRCLAKKTLRSPT